MAGFVGSRVLFCGFFPLWNAIMYIFYTWSGMCVCVWSGVLVIVAMGRPQLLLYHRNSEEPAWSDGNWFMIRYGHARPRRSLCFSAKWSRMCWKLRHQCPRGLVCAVLGSIFLHGTQTFRQGEVKYLSEAVTLLKRNDKENVKQFLVEFAKEYSREVFLFFTVSACEFGEWRYKF